MEALAALAVVDVGPDVVVAHPLHAHPHLEGLGRRGDHLAATGVTAHQRAVVEGGHISLLRAYSTPQRKPMAGRARNKNSITTEFPSGAAARRTPWSPGAASSPPR